MTATDSDKLITLPKGRKAAARPRPRRKIIANREAERNTLGSFMVGMTGYDDLPSGMDDVLTALDILEPQDFYEPKHQIICEAMKALKARGKSFGNIVLLTDHLFKTGQLTNAGGQSYVSGLGDAIATSGDVLEYARIVFDTSIERQTQEIATQGAQLDIPPDDLVERLSKLVERRRALQHQSVTVPGRMLSDVKKEPVHWAWFGRLAYGKATLVDGDGGKGKGLITLDITARGTTGRPMPGETEAAPPMNVILIAPEDSAADTIRPRLEAAGGDPSRVRLLDQIDTVDETGAPTTRPITFPRDTALLEEVIERDNAKLVIIDPIMSCFDAGVKTGIDNEVRAALMPLKQVIERTGAILIMVRHFTKNSEMRAAYRGGGSVAITNLARFGLVVADHPDNPDLCVLALAKSNYEKVPPLAYRIAQGNGDVRVEWDASAAVNMDADTLLSSRGSAERREVVAVLEDAAPAWLNAKEINQRLSTPVQEAALRQRLSRYAASHAILSKGQGEGLYAALSAKPSPDTTPKEVVSHMSQQSYMSQVSQVSQHARLEKQPDCDSVTVVTPSLECDTFADVSVTTDPATCDHPDDAQHFYGNGTLRCEQCHTTLFQA